MTTIDATEIIRRASALVPTLRERSAECEQLRHIPQETCDDFVRLDFLRVCQPEQFGGLGLGVATAAELAMEIGIGCGSTAWMASQWAGHNFWVGFFPLEAQQEYWADSNDVFSSSASAVVRCTSEKVAGGVRISGQWRFSSGVDWARWVLPTTPQGMLMIPRADFQVLDDWYVPGLRGTGSKSMVLDDVFVPQHRIVAAERVATGTSYGAELYDDPLYKVPAILVSPNLLQAPLVGMARGILDLWQERVMTRNDMMTRVPARERAANQMHFAEASAEIDTAMLILRNNLSRAAEFGRSGQPVSRIDVTRFSRNGRYATKLCVQAADRLVQSGDASAMYEPNLLPRWNRDIHMAAMSPGNLAGWDLASTEYARASWDLPSEIAPRPTA